jgi:hypothetical protein
LNLKRMVWTKVKTKFNSYASFHTSVTEEEFSLINVRVPSRNVRAFSLFGVCPSNKHCLSARCAYAAKIST